MRRISSGQEAKNTTPNDIQKARSRGTSEKPGSDRFRITGRTFSLGGGEEDRGYPSERDIDWAAVSGARRYLRRYLSEWTNSVLIMSWGT